MVQEDKSSLIFAIKDYFKIDFDLNNPIYQILSNSISENIACDYNKLTLALKSLVVSNQDIIASSYKTKENSFDVSMAGYIPVSVKGFMSKNGPILYFYKGEDKEPFYKIKVTKKEDRAKFVIESSNNPSVLGNYRGGKHIDESSSLYIIKEDYIVSREGCYAEKKIVANSNAEDYVFSCDLGNYPGEYRRFYNFLLKHLRFDKSNIENLNAEALFANFYEVIKQSMSYENEFPFIDVITIIDNVLSEREQTALVENYNHGRLFEYVSKICNMENHTGITPKRQIIEITSPESKVKNIEVIKSEQYLSVDIFDNNDSKVCSYIVCATNNGFTLFRTIMDENYVQNINTPISFTLNLTENEIKFTSIASGGNLSAVKSPIEMMMGIYPNGIVKFDMEGKYIYPSLDLAQSEMGEPLPKQKV